MPTRTPDDRTRGQAAVGMPRRRSSTFRNSHIACARRAVTLVELMVAIGIVVVLVAIFVPLGRGVLEANRAQTARATLTAIETALEGYVQYWKPLLTQSGCGHGTWVTGVRPSGNTLPLCVPAYPPFAFDPDPNNPNRMPAWDSYASRPVWVNGAALWPEAHDAAANDPATAEFVANQCLAWSLTADAGGGPFFTNNDPSVRKSGQYEDPITESVALGVGNAIYPGTEKNPPERLKVNLVDPWGRPYLYGWEIQIDPNPGIPDSKRVRFVKAWVASSGPDRLFNAQTWIHDAKVGPSGQRLSVENGDNIVP